MPVTFEVNHNDGYYIARWEGRLTDQALVKAYEAFFAGAEWVAGHNSLADLSALDATDITVVGLKALAGLVRSVFEQHNVRPKIAAYAPRDYPFGLTRFYSAKVEDFETFVSFRSKSEAIEWLTSS